MSPTMENLSRMLKILYDFPNDLYVDAYDVQTERNANAAPEENPIERLVSRVANWLPGNTI